MRSLRFADFIPIGLAVDSFVVEEDTAVVSTRSAASSTRCLLCGTVSGRRHSSLIKGRRKLAHSEPKA